MQQNQQESHGDQQSLRGVSFGCSDFNAGSLCAVCTVTVQSLQTAPRILLHLQEELANLNEANTTKYNAVMDSVNLEEVREKAMDDLGMVYANRESGGRIR